MATVEISANLTGQQQVVQGLDNITRELEKMGKQGAENADNLNRRLGNLDRAFTSLKGTVVSLTASFVSFIGTHLSVDAFVNATKAALEYTGRLNDMSIQLGVSTDDLQVMEYAARQNGSSLEAFAGALRRLSSLAGNMAEGTDELRGAFEKYDIAVKNADGTNRDAMQILRAVADRIKEADNNTERLAIASGFLGRQMGAQLIPVLIDGAAGLDKLKQSAREMGLIIDAELIRKADDAGDKLDAMSLVVRNNVYSALIELSPLIIEVAEGLGVISREIIDFLTNVGILNQADLPLTIQIRQLRNELKLAQDQFENEKTTNPFYGTKLYNLMGGDKAFRDRINAAQASLDAALEQRTLRSRLAPGGGSTGRDFSAENEMAKESARLRAALITPEEEHAAALAQAHKLLQAGVEHGGITWVEYGKAVQLANQQLAEAKEKAANASGASKALSDSQKEHQKVLDAINKRNTEMAEQQEKDQAAANKRAHDRIQAMNEFNQGIEVQLTNLARLAEAANISNREFQVTTTLLQLEAQWRKITGALTAEDTKALREKAEALVDLGNKVDVTNEQIQEMANLQGILSSAAGNAFNTVGRVATGNLKNMGDAMEQFRNIALQAIDDVMNAMIKLAITNPLENLMSGKDSASGGLGTIFDLLGGLLGAGVSGGIYTQSSSAFWGGTTPVKGGLSGFFQTGGERIFNKPSLIAVGETGNPERVNVTPLANGGESNRGGMRGGVYIDARGSNGEREIQKAIMRAFRRMAPGMIEASAMVVQGRNRKDPGYLGS